MQQNTPSFSVIEEIGSSPADIIMRADCLQACEYLRRRGQTVDLVYIDPPYASSDSYKRPIYLRPRPGRENAAAKLRPDWQQTVFQDTLSPQDFLAWIEPRLRAIHSVLSSRGSLFLHLDHHISHYVKVMLDSIFGAENFRNEIIWSYRTGGNSKRAFAQKHDTVFFYSKSADYTFNPQYYRSYQAKRYNYNPKYPELWDDKAKRWYHLAVCRDVWDDINVLGTERDGSERLDYPTQKPAALLERLIAAASDEGQTVADFFGGSGVCAETAFRLKRRFFHSDISPISLQTCRDRLKAAGAGAQILTAESGDADGGSAHLEAEILGAGSAMPPGQMTLDDLLDGAPLFRVRLKRYASDATDAAMQKENKRRAARGLEPLPDLSSGSELLTWISVDCESAEGCWHSSLERSLDARGLAWDNGSSQLWHGELSCPRRPLRLKVRDILGRETVVKL